MQVVRFWPKVAVHVVNPARDTAGDVFWGKVIRFHMSVPQQFFDGVKYA